MSKQQGYKTFAKFPSSRRLKAVFVICIFACLFGFIHSSYAIDCDDCTCPEVDQEITRAYIGAQHQETRDYFGHANNVPSKEDPDATIGDGQLGDDEDWNNTNLFTGNIVPALQMMTEQLVTVMMNEMLSIGAILDAKDQLETQLLLQKMQTEAHKDYQPSLGMCTYGTGIRSLATADRKSRVSAQVLEQHFIDRQMGNGVVSGAEGTEGQDGDRNDRLANFVKNYCDYDDNDRINNVMDTGLAILCSPTDATLRSDLNNLNLDIDYTRLVQDPDTIPIDMSNPDATKLNPIFSMQTNLYGSDIMSRISYQQAKHESSRDEMIDIRSVAAKRSVAENSFDTIVGLKSMGSPTANGGGVSSADTLNQYFSVILKDLGVPQAEMAYLLGSQPSYYAQLKFLAKRLYQRPEFYQDLYDTPANVERKKVAMQAINSILEREIYKSHTRSEAIMAQILELHSVKRQNDVQDSLKNLELKRN